ncbi:MAG: hypothetical protein WBG37_21645, partial [Desulfobacterales bacterium]
MKWRADTHGSARIDAIAGPTALVLKIYLLRKLHARLADPKGKRKKSYDDHQLTLADSEWIAFIAGHRPMGSTLNLAIHAFGGALDLFFFFQSVNGVVDGASVISSSFFQGRNVEIFSRPANGLQDDFFFCGSLRGFGGFC